MGATHLQDLIQIVQRRARVDHIFHHQHVAAVNIRAQVFTDLNMPLRLRAVAVARNHHKINLHVQIDLAHQIGHEHRGTLQNAD